MAAAPASAETARLHELFTEALALSTAGRSALVARVRAEDAALADALVALLAEDATADTALVAGGTPPTTDLTGGRGRLAGLPSIPGYRMRAVLGEGGMGTVYAAEQQAPRRPVAIKVLDALSQSALVRFRTEAEIMARLDHPGIARVLEAGDADGRPFLVMEHVDGVTLDRYVADLPRGRRLALFVALCEAVHHAHVKGVIHRDLKPSNVMVRPGDRVVVLDFGVARLAAADGGSDTRAGELIGTPIYMSPEQARLRPDEVDARSDVYTLGVMLYELVSGELPYDIRGLPLAGVALAIVDDAPIPLARRDPALAGDLDAITHKALHKDPAERYHSAAALGDDVRCLLAGLPVSVRTPGSVEQVRRFVRRRPVLASAIASAVLATATFVIVVTRLWLIAGAAQRRTEAARAELEARTNELTLRQARAALARDPTAAMAWLATLVGPGPGASRTLDADAAWGIVDEALGRGVASQVLRGHSDEVHWIEPLPGGDFVTGGYDGKVIVWQAPAYTPRVVYQAPRGRVHLVRPSPDGALLAVGVDDGHLVLIGRDGAPRGELRGHAGDVQHIAWSPDGQILVTSDDQGNVWRWPRGGGGGVQLARSSASVGTLAFSADGAVIVAGNHAGLLWRWNADGSGALTAQLDTDVTDVWADRERVIAVDAAGVVRTWRAAEQLILERTVATHQPTKRAVFATGGAWLVLGGVGGAAVRVEGEAVEVIARHRAQVRYLAITDDGRRVATASDDGVLQVIDRATGRHLTLRGHAARVRHLAFAGGALLSADGEGVIRRWELDATPARVLDGSGAPVDRMAASDDGAWLASIDTEGQVALWTVHGADAGGRRGLGKLSGHASAIAIAGGATPTVITGSAEGEVTWWALAGQVRRAVTGIVRGIAITGDRVAVATSAGPIALFTRDGAPAGELPGNTHGTEALAFAPRVGLLAAGGQDRVIRVYRADVHGAYVAAGELAGPSGDTHFVTWSPAGDRLITAGNDGVVYAWRAVAGAVDPGSRAIVGKHTGAVSGLAVSRDGRWLASGARDDVVIRTALDTAISDRWPSGGAASAIAFDARGDVQAVTRTGAVVHATSTTLATVIEHGALSGVALGGDRLAVALDDGAIVIEQLGPHTLAELTRAVTAATAYRLRAQ